MHVIYVENSSFTHASATCAGPSRRLSRPKRFNGSLGGARQSSRSWGPRLQYMDYHGYTIGFYDDYRWLSQMIHFPGISSYIYPINDGEGLTSNPGKRLTSNPSSLPTPKGLTSDTTSICHYVNNCVLVELRMCADVKTRTPLDTETLVHTHTLLHGDTLTQRQIFMQTHFFTHRQGTHTDGFTHRHFYAQTYLHTETVTQRPF